MTVDDHVLALLRAGGEFTTAHVAGHIDASRQTAFVSLNRLRLCGDVRRIKPGVWSAIAYYTPAEIRARFKRR